MTGEIRQSVREALSFSQRVTLWTVSELRWLSRVLMASGDRFYWGNGFSKAASLAYTTLLSLVPVTALFFSIIGSFAITSSYGDNVVKYMFMHFFPSLDSAQTVLEHLKAFSLVIAGLNAVVLSFVLFTSLLLLNSVEYALNEIWQVFEARSISHRIAIFCAILVIGPIFAISAYYTSFSVEPILAEYGFLSWLNSLYLYLWPFLIDYGAFLALYYLVPKAPVQLRSASFGAFVASLLFDAAKRLFAIYIVGFSSYERIYGTLAAVPIFLFWLYLAWTIVIFGAEVCYQAQYLPKKGKVWKRSVLSVGDAKMVLAVQSLVMIAEAFIKGERLPNELDIAEHLSCSSVVLKPALDELERGRIISRGDSHEMPLTLMRHPATISVEEITQALYQGRPSMFYPAEVHRMFGVFCDRSRTAAVSLADILDEGAGAHVPATATQAVTEPKSSAE